MVLGTVAGVAEGLLATWVLAQVWLLACVAPQVDLQILQAGEGFTAAFELQERLMRGVLSPVGPPAWKQHPKPAFSGPNHLLPPPYASGSTAPARCPGLRLRNGQLGPKMTFLLLTWGRTAHTCASCDPWGQQFQGRPCLGMGPQKEGVQPGLEGLYPQEVLGCSATLMLYLPPRQWRDCGYP